MKKELLALPHGETLNYFCTWMTQNRVGEEVDRLRLKDPAFTGDQGSRSAREQMNEEFIFGKDGVVHLLENVRSSLYLQIVSQFNLPYILPENTANRQSKMADLERKKQRKHE